MLFRRRLYNDHEEVERDIVGMIGLITIVFIPALLVGAMEVLIVARGRVNGKVSPRKDGR